MIFLLHLLMMTTTLLGLPCINKAGHTFENLVSTSQILENEMSVMQLQEPVIRFVLLIGPMSLLDIFSLFLRVFHLDTAVPLLCLLFVFLSGQSNMTFFPKQRLKIISRNNLLSCTVVRECSGYLGGLFVWMWRVLIFNGNYWQGQSCFGCVLMSLRIRMSLLINGVILHCKLF